jgi:hypothetical protein
MQDQKKGNKGQTYLNNKISGEKMQQNLKEEDHKEVTINFESTSMS